MTRGTGGLNYSHRVQRAAIRPTVGTGRPCLVSWLPAPTTGSSERAGFVTTLRDSRRSLRDAGLLRERARGQNAERATLKASGRTSTSREMSDVVVVQPSENRNDCVASSAVRPIASSTSLG